MTNVTLPLPRITIAGNEFRRLGERWIGWGVQQLDGDFEHDFFNSADMGDFLHNTMANTFSGDHAWGMSFIRFHWELWDILDVTSPNAASITVDELKMANLMFVLDAARKNNMYVLLNGCNQTSIAPGRMPAWYNDSFGNLDPTLRWDVQEFAWTEVAKRIVAAGLSSTILGYDLINEPIISSNSTFPWYGNGFNPTLPAVDDNYFTTVIARGVTDPATARTTAVDWMTQLSTAIKAVDPKALITLGALPFSDSNQPFGVTNSELVLDFLEPHLYPNAFNDNSTAAAFMAYANSWAPTSFTDGLSTKPVLVGEFAAWSTDDAINTAFWNNIELKLTNGVCGFSYGYGPDTFSPINLDPWQYPGPLFQAFPDSIWYVKFAQQNYAKFFTSKQVSYLSFP